MNFYTETGQFGAMIAGMNTITGSLFLTLFLIMVLLLFLCLAFRLPIEASAILMLPLLLVLMAMTKDFLAVGGVVLIYLGIMVGKHILFQK